MSEDWEIAEFESDFRIGGRERSRFGPSGSPLYTNDGRYEDIVSNSRIVMAGPMDRGETRISTSVLTLELLPAGSGTRLIITEQAVFLDGEDRPTYCQQGWGAILKWLGVELRRQGGIQA